MTDQDKINEVVDAAIEFIENSGPFVDTDGYVSIAVGDDRRLRRAVEALSD